MDCWSFFFVTSTPQSRLCPFYVCSPLLRAESFDFCVQDGGRQVLWQWTDLIRSFLWWFKIAKSWASRRAQRRNNQQKSLHSGKSENMERLVDRSCILQGTQRLQWLLGTKSTRERLEDNMSEMHASRIGIAFFPSWPRAPRGSRESY